MSGGEEPSKGKLATSRQRGLLTSLALTAYESVLRSAPERLRSEYGATLSAQQAAKGATAARHYRTLLANCSHADPDLQEYAHAKQFLDTP
jgi:hypothetical protein